MYHSPGMYITITDCSENYQSICLMVDEFTTLETPTVRDMVSLAYLPIVQPHHMHHQRLLVARC